MSVTDIPKLDINLYDPALLPDPWPVLAQIREAGELVWNEQGFWMTANDRLCRRIMSHPDTLGQEGLIASLFGEEAFISTDDRSRHSALRNVWVASFGKDGVENLVPVVRRIANQMIDGIESALRAGESIDLVPSLCRPLPAHVIAHMMGVADDMIGTVIEWADLMASATAGGFPIDYAKDPHWLASEKAKGELADYLIAQIRYRRDNPGDDLISNMVHSEVGQSLGEEEMMVNIRQLLFAGNETTGNWLGHILTMLAEYPDERRAMRDDPSLIPAALEEVMRWQGVTQVLPRGVKGDGATVAGIDLPTGAEVILLLGAAGRDPGRWDNPDKFDMHREPKPHLGFGFGLHSCLGATLARMEALEVTTAILQRLPDFRLARPVEYGNFSLRGPVSIVVEAAQA